MSATPGVVFSPPLLRHGPAAALRLADEAQHLGYASFWTVEATGPEAFSLLGAVSQRAPSLGLGTGVIPLQLRTPPLAAMAAATLQLMALDRPVYLGVGVSSPAVAGRWHGAGEPTRPLARMREYVALLRECLSGDRVDFEGDFWTVKGFRLAMDLPGRRPLVVLAALNEGMLRLGGEVADGVLLNYLPATDLPWCVEQVRRGGEAEVLAYVHVGLCDRDAHLDDSRRHLFADATVDAYARAFRRAGYGPAVDEVRRRFADGDKAGAVAAISDEMVDGIDPMGDEELVRGTVEAYVKAGVDVPIVFPLAWGEDPVAMALGTMRAAIAGADATSR